VQQLGRAGEAAGARDGMEGAQLGEGAWLTIAFLNGLLQIKQFDE
jgi:hypothetical protein